VLFVGGEGSKDRRRSAGPSGHEVSGEPEARQEEGTEANSDWSGLVFGGNYVKGAKKTLEVEFNR